IFFSELKYYYSCKDEAYIIPYNPKTRTFQEVSLSIKEIPEDLIVVRIPEQRTLDPIACNRDLDMNKSDLLKKEGVRLNYEAKVIPWHQTRFAETVKRNKEQNIKAEQKPPIQPKPEESKAVN